MNQADPRWVQSGWGYRAGTQDDLMRAISRIGTLQGGRRFVWRGVPDHRYRVRSSLMRSLMVEGGPTPTERAIRDRERVVLDHARKWGVGLDVGGLATDLHLLASLQHHGVPTRLLDVTSNPFTALWFACDRASVARDAAGALIAFDVTGLPEYPTVEPGAPATWGSASDPLGWTLAHALEVSAASGAPFLVRPVLPDARMQAQEGLFIAGSVPETAAMAGVDDLPLTVGRAPGKVALAALFDAHGRKAGRPRLLPFCVITVPPNVKRQLHGHLEGTYNRSFRTLFPDVAGFAKALNDGRLNLAPREGSVAKVVNGPEGRSQSRVGHLP